MNARLLRAVMLPIFLFSVSGVAAGCSGGSGDGMGLVEPGAAGTPGGWRAATGAWPLSIEADSDGPVVVLGGGEVVALAAGDGSERWRVEIASHGTAAPALGHGLAVVPTRTGVAALDRDTGELRWEFPFAAQVSGLTAGDDAVFVGTDEGVLTALDAADGALRFAHGSPGALRTPPRIAPDGAIVATWHSEGASALRVLEPEDGSLRWEKPLTELSSGAVVVGDRVVVGEGNGQGVARVIARDLESGEPVWVQAWPAAFESGIEPVAANGAVTIVDRYGTVARYGAERGERRWATTLRRPVLRTRLVETGGSIWLTTHRGDLVRLDARTGDVRSEELPDGYPIGVAAGPDLYAALRLVDPGAVEARPVA